jgi:cytochrome b561
MTSHLARNSDAGRYDPTTIWLHWTTVGLIVVLWVIGQTADLLPNSSFHARVWSIHVALGLVSAIVLLTRIAWRARFGRILPPADTGALYAVAKATHYVLYVLLAAVVVLGIVDASYRGFNLFGIWSVPKFGTGDAAIRHSINEWHGLAANVMISIAFIHAIAALVHQYVWRDHLINRMAP